MQGWRRNRSRRGESQIAPSSSPSTSMPPRSNRKGDGREAGWCVVQPLCDCEPDFARKFKNRAPAAPDDPKDEETAWLSRGLVEARLRYIDDTPAGDTLRVAAYESTYPPILNALKGAIDRDVD